MVQVVALSLEKGAKVGSGMNRWYVARAVGWVVACAYL